MSENFKVSTHGKWILAGEHAVLRGNPALVFPVLQKELRLTYEPSDRPLSISVDSIYQEPLQLLFWGILEKGLQLLGEHSDPGLKGNILLENDIPVGSGMGFSAALCTAVSRWFIQLGKIAPEQCFYFSQQLEHYFHGKSSGVDIAGAMHSSGVFFKLVPNTLPHIYPLEIHLRPNLYLTYCKKLSVTSECIRHIEKLMQKDTPKAETLDKKMHTSVLIALEALKKTPPEGLQQLAKAINLACECFEQWGLIQGDLLEHLSALRKAGALAVKPTGAGQGGWVLSLWEPDFHFSIPFEHIKISLL